MKHIRNFKRLIVSLITAILAIFALNGGILAYESLQTKNIVSKKEYNEIITEEVQTIDFDEITENQLREEKNENNLEWKIEIPAINLIAPIAEGVSQEVMLEYVGHFETTAFWKGNIGLAAHNRRFSNKLF